jgi:HAD superfamily hydrolase (TIGR01549 family)
MTAPGGGVLLDFDGTLTKPALDWETMKTEMALEDDTIILEFLQTAPPDQARRIAEILERHEIEAARRAEPNEGAREFVEFLQGRNLPMGIVTNNALRHVTVMLERIQLSFENIVTRDAGIWKPDPRHVLLGAEAIGVPAAKCIFIGDGRLDMIAAREAGMTSVHLSSRPGPACDYRVARLAEAIPIIEKLIP